METLDGQYIWRTHPTMAVIIKIRKTAKGGFSALFQHTNEKGEIFEKWERLDKSTGVEIWKRFEN